MTAQARLLGSRYQVGELLGYGGMAEVHRGRDLRLSRDVAIKMLRSDLARDATFQLRFQREAQNAASLNHPAIVAVYDTGEERGPTGETLPYIVMEFVNGRTLKEILGVEGRLMPRRALEITADICAALEFSHRHQIIHRDIKPGNVMLTQTGQVKVMDFGIARALASGASTMTQTSAVIGTAQYLSPEQARGEPVDARSDVYATGCLLYELLTGHPPFTGDNPVSVAYQHVREEAPPPSYANPDVPPDVDAVVLKALAKNPMNRYQSAAEMRADLLRAATGRPVYATPIMREDQVGTMAAAGIPTQVIGARGAGTAARVGNGAQRRGSGWALGVFVVVGVLAAIAIGIGLYLVNQPKTVGVPNLVGRTSTEAAATLNNLKLNGSANPVAGNCTKGNVISQSQQPGLKVNEGTTIRYDVCNGPGPVTLPNDIIGQQKDAATKELQALGLKVNPVGTQSDQPVGQVIDMSPAPGKQVDPGSLVTLTYSTGNNTVQMPNLVGQTATQAEGALQQANLKWTIQYDTSAPLTALGNVTKQDPQPGVSLAKGTTVTIWIGVTASSSPSPSASASASAGPTSPPTHGTG